MDVSNAAVETTTVVAAEATKGFFGKLSEKALEATSNHPVGFAVAGAVGVGAGIYGLYRWSKARGDKKLAAVQAPAAPAADAQAPAAK